jgi:hypothetical protein
MRGIEIAINDYFKMSPRAKRIVWDSLMLHTQEWMDEMNAALHRDEQDYEFDEVLNLFYKGYKERECYEMVAAIVDAADYYKIQLEED